MGVGIAGGFVGYAVGSVFGAAVGTIEGSLTAFKNEFTSIDNSALIAALEESDPGAELAAALKQAIPHARGVSLTRLEGAQPAKDYGHLSGQGYPFVIILTITDVYLIDSVVLTGIRVHLAVEGEVVNTATNERRLVSDWTYTGEPVDLTKLAENVSAIFKSHMKNAWTEILSDIAAHIFPAN